MPSARVLLLALASLGGTLGAAGARADTSSGPDELDTGSAADRVPKLVEALRLSDSFKVRATAAVALGRIGDMRAEPALADALRRDGHYAVRVAAASALGRMPGGDGIPALLDALHDQDGFVRDEASAALGRFHTQDQVYAFRDALSDEDPVRRLAAVRAYGEVLRTNAGVAPLVVGALGDEDDEVKKAAETALAAVPHERAVPVLVQALSSGGSGVRASAAKLLEKRADATAVAPLILLCTASDESEEVHKAACSSLRAHKEYVDVSSQKAAANDTDKDRQLVRLSALRVLAALGDPSANDLVAKAIAEPDATVRVAAARAALDMYSVNGGDERAKKLLEGARSRESDARTAHQLELLLKQMR